MNSKKYLLALFLGLFIIGGCQKKGGDVVVDPGESGMKTVEGIDVDKDGVRDDLQVWIEKEFQEEELVQKAIKEMAKTHPVSCEFKHKTGCLELLVGFDESLRIEIELMERVLNTPERQKDFEEKLIECKFSEELTQQKCPFKH